MPTALLEIVIPITPEGNEIPMIKIEGGIFQMGNMDHESEQPIHEVELSPFWMGQYQVNQELWTEIMGENPSSFKGMNLPVENVSWEEIQLFLKKLNEKLSLRGDQIYRLPTEAEWEYAARGGKYGLKTRYAGSGNLDKVGWYGGIEGKGHSETQQLGLKVPNELGLYDMSGNVWEWCQDWYDSYSADHVKDPKGPKDGRYRVLRGGSWVFYEDYCRVSYRYRDTPGHRDDFVGFRLSRTAW